MIQIRENINDVAEFNLLYDSVGWGAYDKKITKKAMENTCYSVSIYDDKKIIGYGRLIGDGICFMYIQDVMVIPEYQTPNAMQMMNGSQTARDKLGGQKGKSPDLQLRSQSAC